MSTIRINWTRDELILAINLYCKLPFGKMHKGNPDIIVLARLLGRTPSSIALKLVNFASLDPSLQARGIRGASNVSKLDREVWAEFYQNWDAALLESEQLLAVRRKSTVEDDNAIVTNDIPAEGLEKERVVMARINQHLFRKMVLATYNNTCCITGIAVPELLVASHIVPWSIDAQNRLYPGNGLCLNALHDRAFDRFLITVDAESYKVRISSRLSGLAAFDAVANMEIRLPDKFRPVRAGLAWHNERFVG